jgi:hypothetical protein
MRLLDLYAELNRLFPDYAHVLGYKNTEELRADVQKLMSVFLEREQIDRNSTISSFVIIVAHKKKLSQFDEFQSEVDAVLQKLYSKLPLTDFSVEYANNDIYLFALIKAQAKRRLL